MDDRERGQVIASAAEVYDEFFVPALFQAWAEPVCDAAGVGPGDHVLDVACGTGVVTRAVAARVGRAGRVVGLDVNAAMLTVARRKAPNLDLRLGRAESLPFEDGTFDAVTCQFALMFFEDRPAALAEMHRVLRPGGRLAVSVWDAADRTPGYAAVIALLERLFGPRVADALRAPFVLGDPSVLRALLVKAGITDASIETRAGVARFPSVGAWMHTDVKGWTLADMLDDGQFARLLGEAEEALRPFVSPDGTVSFPAPAHIVCAEKKPAVDL
jgi:ubiquinone/menaquinone biosynthesis C-methylase UbiE